MAAKNPLYDLIVMLDTVAPDDRRAKVLSDVEDLITAGGEVVTKQEWGPRATAYEINHKADADYHLVQFHGTPALLQDLDRVLRFADEVIRFRVIKLAPGTPDAPETRPEPRPASTAVDTQPAAAEAPAEDDAPVAEAPAEEAPALADEPAGEPAPAA